MIQQIAFALVAFSALGIAAFKFLKIRRNILLGNDIELEGETGTRLKNMTLIALGQKKMFKRIVPAVMHLFIYVAFLFTQIEVIEIFVDGLSGSHRFFLSILGPVYTVLISFIEILSVLALIGTFVFLARRNLLKIPRFHKPEMNGWPKLDGNIILYLEILLIVFIFTMNGSDEALHIKEGKGSYGFAISQYLSPIFSNFSEASLHTLERVGWWGHILTVFAFMLYLPFSKHLHIFLAFPNVFYGRLNPAGEMSNMPTIMKEVQSMFDENALIEEAPVGEELPSFGAKDIFDLSWKNIMDAYTCTECGRCTSECPANITGKKLSPRKIMMDVRDRAETVGKNIDANNQDCLKEDAKSKNEKLSKDNYEDGKSLFDLISTEELRACTTCNACVEACPVMINPLDIILQMRRHQVLDMADSPEEWNVMFSNIENNGAPWQFSPDDRDKWVAEAQKEEGEGEVS